MYTSLADHSNHIERLLALKSAHVTPEQLHTALNDPHLSVRSFAAQHPKLPPEIVHGDLSGFPVDVQNTIQHRSDHAAVQEAGWSNPDANFVDVDPWVQAKYRRGGHQVFDRYLREVDAGLHKNAIAYSDLSRPITTPLLYQAYKHSPHHPVSLLLKYVVNRLENRNIYEKGTPDQIAQHEQAWLQHHKHEKNDWIELQDLHQAIQKNPHLLDGVQEHQRQLHQYIQQHNPDAIKDINGQPHIALSRGYSIPNPGADHDIASYTDENATANEFGGHVKHWWVPLKNVWYSYHVGHPDVVGGYGAENELLASNHPRLPAKENEIQPVVPKNHFGYTKPTVEWELGHTHDIDRVRQSISHPARNVNEIITQLAALKNRHIPSDALQTPLNSPSADIRAAALAHPNASVEQIHHGLQDSDPLTASAAAMRPDLTREHLTQALQHHSPMVRKLAVSHPNIQRSHLKSVLKDSDESVRGAATQKLQEMSLPKVHPPKPPRPSVTAAPAVTVGDTSAPKSYGDKQAVKHGWRQTSEGLHKNIINELGLGVRQELYYNTINQLCQHEFDANQFREAFVKSGDLAIAALITANLPHLLEYREAIHEQAAVVTFSNVLNKSEMDVKAVLPEGQTTADAIQRAFKSNQVEEVQLGGKHSKGTMVAEDPEHKHFLLKPGSGKLSPAAGVREEAASQARRECAFWHVARNWGIDRFFPRADLIALNGKEVAALHRLPWSWKNFDELVGEDPQSPAPVLNSYLKNGDLHRWAVIDAVLGQTDRHGANIMVSPKEDGYKVALIDQGSALAGPSFSPGTDPKSFIPYYLRVWRADDWDDMNVEQRLKSMPEVHGEVQEHLQKWTLGLRYEDLESILTRYGVSPQASLARLAHFQQLALVSNFSAAINRWWLGI